MKEEKRKVGRPKLADDKLKRNALLMCLGCILVIIGAMVVAIFTLTVGNYNKVTGAAVNSYYMNNDFTYFSQREYPWNMVRFCGRTDYKRYSKRKDKYPTIATSGCGVTAMAMVLNNLVSTDITPKVTMNEAYKAGYCGRGISGTNNRYIKYAANKYNLKYTALTRNKAGISKAANILRNGGLLVASVNSRSPFTSGSHYIVIYKIDDQNNVYVANPNKLLNDPKDKLARDSLKAKYRLSTFVNSNWINSGWWGLERTKNTKSSGTYKSLDNMKCPKGYKKCTDDSCECRATTPTAGKVANNSCEAGYVEGENQCWKVVNPSDGKCPSGYTECTGKSCECKKPTKSTYKNASECKAAIKKSDGYEHSVYSNGVCYRITKKSVSTCPSGSIKCSSNKCSCKVAVPKDKATACLDGYVLEKGKCYKTANLEEK